MEISRIEPAELNQEFFDKFLAKEVNSEEEARGKIRGEDLKVLQRPVGSASFPGYAGKLMEINEMELPEEFLKRWMKATNESFR